MPISRILLGFSESADAVIANGTLRTLCFLAVRVIQATLMERVLAKKMDNWWIKTSPTGRASSSLKQRGLITQFVHLLARAFSLGTIAFDQATVLGTGQWDI